MESRLICVIAFLLFAFTGYAQIKALNGKNIPPEAMDRFIQHEMDSLGIPGMSVAVINDGRIVYHRALGITSILTRTPVDDSSIFEAASLSKPLFAYFVLKMVDKGMLNLDTPLYRYLPYPDIAGDHRYKLITARIVLTHQTGFPNWRYFNRADSSRHIKDGDLYLNFTPGTQFSYSGEGYVYLAKVIAQLNHTTLQGLDAVFQQEVARPLHLGCAWYTGNPYIRAHKVSGHENGIIFGHADGGAWGRDERANGYSWPVTFPTWDSTWFNPAAGLHTEAVSYGRFLIALMIGKGLSHAMMAEMLRPQVYLPKGHYFYHSYQDTAWGLGIGIAETPYGMRYDHAGSNGNFESHAVFFKDRKYGYVFLSNSNKGDAFFNRLNAFLTTGEIGTAEYPGAAWRTNDHPENAGWDTAKLARLTRFVIDSTQVTGMLIIHQGQIVYQFGDIQENSYIASCRKSVLAMLYGPYVAAGKINLQQTIGELGIDDVGGLLPIEKTATLDNVLHARSGVYHPGSYPGDDLNQAPPRGSVQPGSYWLYSNWDFNVAGYVFEKETGKNIFDEVERQLALPLHMQDWRRDLQQKEGDSTASLYPAYPMWFSTRDMARIGLLMLRNGRWGNKQLIPQPWVHTMLTPETDYTEVLKNSRTYRGLCCQFGYGLLWWLWQNTDDPRLKGGYSALGYMGQTITVFPGIDAVVVFKTKAAYQRPSNFFRWFKLIQLAGQCHQPLSV